MHAFFHFLCDVPHITQCVRNHLLTHTYAKAGTNRINFKHYERLYNAEKDSHLKIVPKLTSSHIKPSKLEKMNVRLATQLFSRSVAIGPKFCREQREPGFEDGEGTEKFMMQVIKNFLIMLNMTEKNSIERNTKLFASQLTTESLRVTLMSVLDIITLVLDKDIRYVLTAKLNQDPLEVVIFKVNLDVVCGCLVLQFTFTYVCFSLPNAFLES